jgi:hypothetical protein
MSGAAAQMPFFLGYSAASGNYQMKRGPKSIAIAGPTSRITPSKLPELAEHVIKAAEKISSRLGYQPKARAAAAERELPMRFFANSARAQTE